MKRVIFACVALLALGAVSLARWGSGGCGSAGSQLWAPSVVFAQPAQRPVNEWRTSPGDGQTFYLYRKGVQIGGYCYDGGYWRDYDADKDTWGEKIFCERLDVHKHIGAVKATEAPKAEIPKAESAQNYGVDWDKIHNNGASDNSGRFITKEKAIEMIQAPDIPDYKKKLRITCIGTEAECKGVTDQLSQLEPAISERIIARAVRPGDWSTKDLTTGQVVYKDGSPSVYCQTPEGKVLHRQADGGNVVDAIRKAVKKYDADKDPDLRKPVGPIPNPLDPSTPLNPVMLVLLALGGLALFAFAKGRKQ